MGCNCNNNNNNNSLLQGPAGNNGANGANATCTNGVNAISRIDTSFGLGACNTTNIWTTIGYIIYPGTSNLPSPITKIYTIASTTSNGQLRLISGTGTIATSSIITNGNPALIDLGAINNSALSNTVQVLQLQTIANGGQINALALSLLSI